MGIVVVIIIAVVGFFMWSNSAAKTTRAKYVFARSNALAERFQGYESQPTWWNWRDESMRAAVKNATAPIIAKSGLSPAAVQLWLDADETWEDFLTFMDHAEKIGFKRIEQVVLLEDFAMDALREDVSSEQTIRDKNVLLYLVAGTKQRQQQNVVDVDDLSYRVVEEYLVRRGATVDDEVPEGHRYYDYAFDYRSSRPVLNLDLGMNNARLFIYDNSPDPYRSFRPQTPARRPMS